MSHELGGELAWKGEVESRSTLRRKERLGLWGVGEIDCACNVNISLDKGCFHL